MSLEENLQESNFWLIWEFKQVIDKNIFSRKTKTKKKRIEWGKIYKKKMKRKKENRKEKRQKLTVAFTPTADTIHLKKETSAKINNKIEN